MQKEHSCRSPRRDANLHLFVVLSLAPKIGKHRAHHCICPLEWTAGCFGGTGDRRLERNGRQALPHGGARKLRARRVEYSARYFTTCFTTYFTTRLRKLLCWRHQQRVGAARGPFSGAQFLHKPDHAVAAARGRPAVFAMGGDGPDKRGERLAEYGKRTWIGDWRRDWRRDWHQCLKLSK